MLRILENISQGGGVENTRHLLFECPEYSEIAWEGLNEVHFYRDKQYNSP